MVGAPLPYAFVSYSHVDRPFAARLGRDLRANNIDIWIDALDIASGSAWDQNVEQALAGAKVVLFIVSEASVQSKNARDELQWAIENGKHVIPIVIANVQAPLSIFRLQRVDFTRDYAEGFDQLVRALSGTTSRTRAFEGLAGVPQPWPRPIDTPANFPGSAVPYPPGLGGSSAPPVQKDAFVRASPTGKPPWLLLAVLGGCAALALVVGMMVIAALEQSSPVPAGLLPGAPLGECVCMGVFVPGVVNPNQLCASGYQTAARCPGMCPSGAFPWRLICN